MEGLGRVYKSADLPSLLQGRNGFRDRAMTSVLLLSQRLDRPEGGLAGR